MHPIHHCYNAIKLLRGNGASLNTADLRNHSLLSSLSSSVSASKTTTKTKPATPLIPGDSSPLFSFFSSFMENEVSKLLFASHPTPSHLLQEISPILLPHHQHVLHYWKISQLSSFPSQNNLRDNNQSGFRSRHSTETALLTTALLKDFGLLQIICSQSAGPLTLLTTGSSWWFQSYLTGRSFSVMERKGV